MISDRNTRRDSRNQAIEVRNADARRWRILAGVSLIAVGIALAHPAWAASPDVGGGAGGMGGGAKAGAGGQTTDGVGAKGGDAADTVSGGGGGGVGKAGGKGGGATGGAGGAVGVGAGANGGKGGDAVANGGGGGGAGGNNGLSAAGGALAGGAGGKGGDGGAGGATSGSGGGGGAGGYGVLVTGGGTSALTGDAKGGDGGAGGKALASTGTGGNGGGGGIGLLVTSTGGGASVTVDSGKTVSGGAGGKAGAGTNADVGGAGGAGFVANAAGVTLTNNGTITGGKAGAGAPTGSDGAGVVGGNLKVVNNNAISGGGGAAALDFRAGANTLSSGNSGTLNGAINIEAGSLTLSQTGMASASHAYGNAINGAGSVIIDTGSTITLSGANTYTGATTVEAGGTLKAGKANALSQSSPLAVYGTLDLNGAGQTVTSLSGSGDVTNTAANTMAILKNQGATSLFSGVIEDGGATAKTGLTQAGPGTLILSGQNTYTGATLVTDGVLMAGADTAFSQKSATTIDGANAVLDLGGDKQAIDSVTLTSGTLRNGGLSGAIVSANGEIDNVTAGSLGTAASLEVTGNTTLNGTDTFSGVTVDKNASLTNNGVTTDQLTNNGVVTNNGVYTSDKLVNTSTGTVTNNGQFNAPVANDGQITNNAQAVWNGAVLSNNANALITNIGAWNGSAANTGGTIDNKGTWTGDATNTGGTITNENMWKGSASNNGGTIDNQGTWTGSVNNASGTFKNSLASSVLTGLLTNSDTALNVGTIAGGVDNFGTFTQVAGATTSGGLTNETTGQVFAAGTIDGVIANSGKFTVFGGNLAGNGSAFNNNANAVLSVTGGDFTGVGALTNDSKAAGGGVVIGANHTLSATGVTNNGLMVNNGALASASVIMNAGGATLNNNGVVTGGLNNAGTFNQTVGSSLSGGLTNTSTGTVNAAGAISGAISNGGAFTVAGGTLTSDGSAFANTGANGVLVVQSNSSLTGVGALTNDSTAAGTELQVQANGSISAASFVNSRYASNAGTIASATVIVNAGNGGIPANLSNSGLITGGLNNAGIYTQTPTGTLTGGLTNSDLVDAAGTLKGGITQNGAATFNVTNALYAAGGAFVNNDNSVLNVSTGDFTGVGQLTNNSTTKFGVNVTMKLGADSIVNNKGAFFYNSGRVVSAQTIVNNGDYNNSTGVTTGGLINNGTFEQQKGGRLEGGLVTSGTATSYGVITGGAKVTGGTLTSGGSILGGLVNMGTVSAQGIISGGVKNTGAFVVTADLDNGNGHFNNTGAGTLSFAAGNLAFGGIDALSNSSTAKVGVDIGATDILGATTVDNKAGATMNIAGVLQTNLFKNEGSVYFTGTGTGFTGTVIGSVDNTGSVFLGTRESNPYVTHVYVSGNYTGTGTTVTSACLSSCPDGKAEASNILIGGKASGVLDIAIDNNHNNTTTNAFFNKLVIASSASGAFTVDAATKAELNTISNTPSSFYTYLFDNSDPKAQGILQLPKTAAAAAPVSQVVSTVMALNASFFQNSSAFLGQARNPNPNYFGLGVWNRDGASQTTISSVSTLQGGAVSESSKVDTRLIGTQVGLDGAVYNIQNSGMNVHFGVTTGEVFATSSDLANAGVSATTRVPFVGVYGALTGKGFADIMQLRYDDYEMSLTNPAQQIRGQGLNPHGLTFSNDIQYVIPMPGNSFIEPSAGIYLSRVSIPSESFNSGVDTFGSLDSVMGRVGLRAGVSAQAGTMVYQPYASLNLFHEFAGDAQTTFSPTPALPGNPNYQIETSRLGTFAQASVGVGLQAPGTGWTGYLRTDARFGTNVQGWGLTGGVRYSF